MKISIIAILISLSAIGYGQQGVYVTRGDTIYNWPIINGDTIKNGERIELRAGRGITIMDHGGIHPVGRVTPYEVWDKPYSSSVAELLELYDKYLAQQITYSRHPDGFFNDCDIEMKSEEEGINLTMWEECVKVSHYKPVPVKSSLEGFIKWLKQQ